MNFGSHTDAVVAVAAQLVNAATPGDRQGRPYAVPAGRDLVAALQDALAVGSRHHEPVSASRAPAFVELAEAARPVFEAVERGDVDTAAGVANGLLSRYRPQPFLDHHDGEPWHLHFHGREDSDATGWGGGVSVGLATVLGSADAHRLGVCGAPVCDRVYVDVSRNGTRRFCSTACQNRVKVAAHRARAAR